MWLLSSDRGVHSTLQSDETNSTPCVGFRKLSWVELLSLVLGQIGFELIFFNPSNLIQPISLFYYTYFYFLYLVFLRFGFNDLKYNLGMLCEL